MDRFAPVAPAHIRVVVLPVGQIERPYFLAFVERLRTEASIISLGDIPVQDHGQDELAPKSFSQGSLLFNFTISGVSEPQLQLSPFELFREPLLVVGVIHSHPKSTGPVEEEFKHAAEHLRERYSHVVHRQLLVLSDDSETPVRNALRVRVSTVGDNDSLKNTMCELSRQFLVELAIYTKAMQASPSIPTPGHTARSLQRTTSMNGEEKRPASSSGYSTPTQGIEVSSPVGGDSPSRPPSRAFGSPPPLPATSFDQIQAASAVHSALSRSDSRASNKSKNGNRASSQDRVSVQGFGSGTSQEKLKQRGRARVGIVVGHLIMMSGQWSEALRALCEHTIKARTLGDNLWHAKGLEGTLVCLLLLAWAGVDFQMPSICVPNTDRPGSAHTQHVQRFSVNLPADFKPGDSAHEDSVRRLSTSLPELLSYILKLYRSLEGSLELPAMVVSEVTVRFCKLLSFLNVGNGELNQLSLASMVGKYWISEPSKQLQFSGRSVQRPSRAAIAEMLDQARLEDGVDVPQRIAILAAIASVYDLLRMQRKKAMVIEGMFSALTAALDQARKVGAAEAGIHPAASLSEETGTQAVLEIVSESEGFQRMMTEFVQSLHNETLKKDILKQLIALAEVTADPNSALFFSSLLLSSFSPTIAVDLEAPVASNAASGDDQIRLAATFSRTNAVSKHLGLDIQAKYWDPYMVRRIEFVRPDPSRLLHLRSNLASTAGSAGNQRTGNPLLYDPNEKLRTIQQQHILVCNEPTACLVTLQNPLEISFHIEGLTLATYEESSGLVTEFEPTTIGPRRLQQVTISVYLTHPGQLNVIGCNAKIAGCREQLFPTILSSWSPCPTRLLKEFEYADPHTNVASAPPSDKMAVIAAPAQPYLTIERVTPTNISLIEGERRSVEISIRNSSDVSANVLDVAGVKGLLEPETAVLGTVIESNNAVPLRFVLTGRHGISELQAMLRYGPATESYTYTRVVTTSISMTVTAGVHVQHPEIEPVDEVAFMLSFNISNGWPDIIECRVSKDHVLESVFDLGSGKSNRMHLRMERPRSATEDEQTVEDIRTGLLSRLQIQWCGDDGRIGEVDLSRLPFTSEMIEVVYGKAISMTMELTGEGALTKDSAKLGGFVIVQCRLVNRTKQQSSEPLFVRLQSAALGSPHNDRRLAVAGAVHRILGPLPAGNEATVDFALCPLFAGSLEVQAIVTSLRGDNKWQCESLLRIRIHDAE